MEYKMNNIVSISREQFFESVARGKLRENCELQRTNNVQGQILEHIFAPEGLYCNTSRFQNWGLVNSQLRQLHF